MSLCPATDCGESRREKQIFCRRHWFMVPQELRNRIWKLYREQAGSPAHLDAIKEAIKGVNS
tara:strand:+ start:579 stop:764 length:186 start_codon:yes stop_codon:yes gene_type:complete